MYEFARLFDNQVLNGSAYAGLSKDKNLSPNLPVLGKNLPAIQSSDRRIDLLEMLRNPGYVHSRIEELSQSPIYSLCIIIGVPELTPPVMMQLLKRL
jgi:hypothetical protein